MYVLFAALAAAAGFHPSATSLTIVDVCPFSPLRQHRLLFLSGQVPNGHILACSCSQNRKDPKLSKTMEKAKKFHKNVSIVAEKCKSTMAFGTKKWALDLLLKQTHKEEDNSNCGKSCLQSNRHLYLKLSNFLNGGFRVLFSSLWASLDDLLFTSLDTRYYRRVC